MRVTAYPNDPAHWGLTFTHSPTILLDGHPVEYVVEADDEAGTVTTYVREGGRLKFEPVRGPDGLVNAEPVIKVRTGRVEIIGQRRSRPHDLRGL
jgi:hypothetical protein